jgi:hypothetical protein
VASLVEILWPIRFKSDIVSTDWYVVSSGSLGGYSLSCVPVSARMNVEYCISEAATTLDRQVIFARKASARPRWKVARELWPIFLSIFIDSVSYSYVCFLSFSFCPLWQCLEPSIRVSPSAPHPANESGLARVSSASADRKCIPALVAASRSHAWDTGTPSGRVLELLCGLLEHFRLSLQAR